MLDANLKAQLKAYLERVTLPFEITASLDDSAASREMHALLGDIVTLTDKITLKTDGNDARKPSFALGRIGEPARVRFAAIPMGHEFTSLVLALLQVGGHPAKLEAELIEQIKELDGDYRFETYMSLTCHNCPDVVQALNLMAVLNPRIESVVIDGGLYQQEVADRDVMAVPMVFVNGKHFGQGRMDAAEIVAKLDTGTAARDAAKLDAKDAYDVLIVGGGPGRRGGGGVRGAQGHSHRPARRTHGRPDDGHDEHRELHLGARNRWPEVRRGARAARQALRGRHAQPAACREAAPCRRSGRADRRRARERRDLEEPHRDRVDRRALA